MKAMKHIFVVVVVILSIQQFVLGYNINVEEIKAPYLPNGTVGTGCNSIGPFMEGKVIIDNYNSYSVFDIEDSSFSTLDIGGDSFFQVEDDWYVVQHLFMNLRTSIYEIYPSSIEIISTCDEILFLDSSGANIQFDSTLKQLVKYDSGGKVEWISKSNMPDEGISSILLISDNYIALSTYTQTWIYSLSDGELKLKTDFTVYKGYNVVQSDDVVVLSNNVYSLPDLEFITKIPESRFIEIDSQKISTATQDSGVIFLNYYSFDGQLLDSKEFKCKYDTYYFLARRLHKYMLVANEKDRFFEVINIKNSTIELVIPYNVIGENQDRIFTTGDHIFFYLGRIMYGFNVENKTLTEIEVPTSMTIINDKQYWYHGKDNIIIKNFDETKTRTIPYNKYKSQYLQETIIQTDGAIIYEFPINADIQYCPIIHENKITTNILRPINHRIIFSVDKYFLFLNKIEEMCYNLSLYCFEDRKWEEMRVWKNITYPRITHNKEFNQLLLRIDNNVEILDTDNYSTVLELQIVFSRFERNVTQIGNMLYTKKRIYDLEGKKFYSGDDISYAGCVDQKYYFQDEDKIVEVSNEFQIRTLNMEVEESIAVIGNTILNHLFLYSMDEKPVQWFPTWNFFNDYLFFRKPEIFVSGRSLLLSSSNNGEDSPITKFDPCPTFSINQIKNKEENKVSFETQSTRNDGLTNIFEGTAYLVAWGENDAGNPLAPIFVNLNEERIRIKPMLHGMKQTITFDLPSLNSVIQNPEMEHSDGASDLKYFALVIESNGLLDTEKSKLSEIDKTERPLFDGTPTSLKYQQSIVLTVWEVK